MDKMFFNKHFRKILLLVLIFITLAHFSLMFDNIESFISLTYAQIKNAHGICLDASQRNKRGGKVRMWDCNTNDENQQWNYYPDTKQIKNAHGICLDASQRNKRGGKVHMWGCNTNNNNQQWDYYPDTKQIKNAHGICLDASQRNKRGGKVHMWGCNTNNKNQQWEINSSVNFEENRLNRNKSIQESIRSNLNQGTSDTNIRNCAVPYTDKLQLSNNSTLFGIFGDDKILKCNPTTELPEFIPAKTEELHSNGMSLINIGQGDDYIRFGNNVSVCGSEYKISGKAENTKVKYGDNIQLTSLETDGSSFDVTVNPNVYGLLNVKDMQASGFSDIYETGYSLCGNSTIASELAVS